MLPQVFFARSGTPDTRPPGLAAARSAYQLQQVGCYELAVRPIITASFLPMAVGSAFFAQMTASGLNRTNRRSLWRLGLFVLGVVAGLAILLLADKLSALLYGPIAV